MTHIVPTTVCLRVMRPDDIPAGLLLCRASGWNQVARDWELFLALSPDGCRVAVDERGRVVGSVATLRYGTSFSWIAMVLVDPSHRGAGVGSRLLKEALTLLERESMVRLDATPAGFGVYERAGFGEERRLQRMQRAPQAISSAMPHGVRFMTEADLDEVLAWDEQVFGADRRMLLNAFRRNAPEYAWVTGDGPIRGYLFGRRGHAFEHLGPLVARDEDTARQLVTGCLAAHPERPFILDVPQLAPWAAWLESNQFTVQRPFIRMGRGEPRYRARPDQMFAILGPEFG